MFRPPLALALVLLSAVASAGDFYVDAQNGDDLNGGTSSSDAWKTITHALAVVPTPPTGQVHAIHVASGLYDAALGESYPLVMRPGLQLLGDATQHPVLDGGSQPVDLVLIATGPAYQQASFDALTVVAHVDLRRARRGFWIYGDNHWNNPQLLDSSVSEMTLAAIEIYAYYSKTRPSLAGLTLQNNTIGIRSKVTEGGTGGFVLADSMIRDNTSHGIDHWEIGGALSGYGDATIDSTSILGNGGSGLWVHSSNRGQCLVDVSRSLIARNNEGIQAGGFYNSNTVAHVSRTTIVDNVTYGCHVDGPKTAVTLRESIVFGNLPEIYDENMSLGTFTATYNDVSNGYFGTSFGNFAADPLFANAALGDYTLTAGSPCIDAGDPASPLDADCSRREVGAFEFAQQNQTVYCTAKPNSCGTLPAIASAGAPSASSTGGFTLSVANTKAGKSGLLLYSIQGRAALPFGGGWLCLAGTVKRTVLVLDTIGTPGNCDGLLALDLNAFSHGLLGGSPLPALTVPGTRVDCQFWARDTLANVLLSDALEYFVCL